MNNSIGQQFNSNSLWTTLIYCLVLINITAKALVITDCSSGSKPDASLGVVSIDGCSQNDDSCSLIRGQNASIKVDFQAVKPFNSAKLDVAGKIGIWIPFLLKPDQACGNYGFDCPVKANEKKTLKISLPIQRSWPKLKVDIRVKLLDENKNLIICFTLPARIEDPKNNNRSRL